jgi:hypothetical protein
VNANASSIADSTWKDAKTRINKLTIKQIKAELVDLGFDVEGLRLKKEYVALLLKALKEKQQQLETTRLPDNNHKKPPLSQTHSSAGVGKTQAKSACIVELTGNEDDDGAIAMDAVTEDEPTTQYEYRPAAFTTNSSNSDDAIMNDENLPSEAATLLKSPMEIDGDNAKPTETVPVKLLSPKVSDYPVPTTSERKRMRSPLRMVQSALTRLTPSSQKSTKVAKLAKDWPPKKTDVAIDEGRGTDDPMDIEPRSEALLLSDAKKLATTTASVGNLRMFSLSKTPGSSLSQASQKKVDIRNAQAEQTLREMRAKVRSNSHGHGISLSRCK